jgi:hypothetical protein
MAVECLLRLNSKPKQPNQFFNSHKKEIATLAISFFFTLLKA